jgi:hypothetical protein
MERASAHTMRVGSEGSLPRRQMWVVSRLSPATATGAVKEHVDLGYAGRARDIEHRNETSQRTAGR